MELTAVRMISPLYFPFLQREQNWKHSFRPSVSFIPKTTF